jgi:hypothetical protein
VALDVLNGTDLVGLAGQNAAQLRKDGFRVETVDSSSTAQAGTQIEYPAGKQSAAKAVLAVVPGAQTVLTASVKRVTLVLGSDGRQVRGLASTVNTPTTHAAAKPASKTTKTGGLGCIN